MQINNRHLYIQSKMQNSNLESLALCGFLSSTNELSFKIDAKSVERVALCAETNDFEVYPNSWGYLTLFRWNFLFHSMHMGAVFAGINISYLLFNFGYTLRRFDTYFTVIQQGSHLITQKLAQQRMKWSLIRRLQNLVDSRPNTATHKFKVKGPWRGVWTLTRTIPQYNHLLLFSKVICVAIQLTSASIRGKVYQKLVRSLIDLLIFEDFRDTCTSFDIHKLAASEFWFRPITRCQAGGLTGLHEWLEG